MERFKRVLSIILVVVILIPMIPVGEIVAYGEDGQVKVDRIEVTKAIDGIEESSGIYTILITGENLNKAKINYRNNTSGKLLDMPEEDSISGNQIKQYTMEAGEVVSSIYIGGKKPFPIKENDIPKIREIKGYDGEDTRQFDLGGDLEGLRIYGSDFDKLGIENGVTTSILIDNEPADEDFKSYDSNENQVQVVDLDKNRLSYYGMGRKNIRINRESVNDGVDFEFTYLYSDAMYIYEGIDIDSENDVSIYPNRGKKGTEVEATIEGKGEEYSIFFKENATDFYTVDLMGADAKYPKTTDGRTIIRFKVPEGVDSGKTYKLFITNNLDKQAKNKDGDYNLTPLVIREQHIGEFYVVDSETGPYIEKIDPPKGSSDGSYVSIYAKRLEELNIPELEIGDNAVGKDQVSIPQVGTSQPTKLKIEYKTDADTKYKGQAVEEITRDFLVTIGRDAVFEKEHLSKQRFQYGESKDDTLYVKTRTISPEDLINPTKDVIIEITTTIKVNENGETKEYTFTESIRSEDNKSRYTFLISSQDPIIEEVTPDEIQVNTSDYKTKNDTVISIKGEKFNVFRYEDANITKTNYPKIALGGIDKENAQIIIEKLSNGEVKYYKNNGDEITLSEESKKRVIFKVLDKNGNEVDGVGKNEEGTSIVVTIPKGVQVEKNKTNNKAPVAIANPERDTSGRRRYNYENDMINFVTVKDSPSITSVVPNKVTVLGGEEVVIRGSGFKDGIQVFIYGEEVKGVKKEIDKITTRGVLTFKAPKGAEGITVVMVRNPKDGGSDTYEFVYVQSSNLDPKLSRVIPDKGTEDDIIILRGNNFLKPDPTVKDTSGIGIDRLIGTTVKIGGVDVNGYNPGKKLETYTAPGQINEKLIQVEENTLLGIRELKLGKAYKNSIIKSGDKIYTIRKNTEGTMDIVGTDNIYTFFLEDGKVMARDENGVEYQATIENQKIILKSPGMEKVFDISYDFDLFSIASDERGSEFLKTADYYNSIYLWDSENSKYFIISKDEKGQVVLTDGRDENYEVKMIGSKIAAGSNDLTIEKDSITINNRKLSFKTPYKVEGNIIVGHRIEILNTGEIEVRVPRKDIPKKYDVTVTNPDTKSSTIKNGFEYIGSSDRPDIYYITPPEGTIDGGYVIEIGGARFDKDTKVLIDGIPGTNVVVDQRDYSSLKVKVPKYRGTEEDFVSQKKFVRVHVITRTGQASTKNMFAYKLTSSNPSIRLLDTKGSTAGGKIIRLVGKDIRFYEPYTGNPPTAGSIPGVDYEDIDGNKRWTNILTDKHEDAKPVPLVPPTPDYTEYLSSPVLPVVTFGNNQAKIVEFRKQGDEHFIELVLPPSDVAGPVDVILTNNDRAQSNVVKFNYEGSKPNIKSIIPANGRRAGGEKRDIEATGYEPSKIKIIDENGKEAETSMNLIRFGESTNKNTDIDDYDAGGRIRNGNASVNLKDSKLKVELRDKKLTFTLEEDQEYVGTYPLTTGTKYINLKSLKGKDSKEAYKGLELVKVSIRPEGKLEVERGFSPSVKERIPGILETTIPSHYKIGNVDVAIVNKDGESNKVKFEYTNPDSQPRVTEILRDGEASKTGSDGKNKIQQVSIKGGALITVEGSDFRNNPNPTIIIGNKDIVIPSSAVTFESDKKLTFTMPQGNEAIAGKLLNLIVQNDDKGTGQSKNNTPPLYMQIISGETDPTTGNISPDKGPVSGGTEVTITGTDFRQDVDGYNGELEIFFGTNKVAKEDIISFTYNKIVLRTPKAEKQGRVPVKIVNPDGTPTDNNIFFTYVSEPKIFDVNPKTLFINDDETEITITGEMFMPGAKVTINDLDAVEVKFVDDKTLKVRFPKMEKIEDIEIQVINPDGGESNKYTGFKYELPLPLKPMVLEAIAGYEGTVMLVWNKSDPDILNKATNYEIYGRKSSEKENTFIATTDKADYLLKGLEKDTEYTFLVRALNEYGGAIDFATVKVRTLSKKEDPKQKEKEEQLREDEKNLELKGKETIVGTKLTKTLGRENIVNGIGNIDLSLEKYKNVNDYTIKIPLALARTDSNLIIKDSGMNLTINPKHMYTYKVSALDTGDKDANLIIHIKKARETNIPRGKKVASLGYAVDFKFQNSKTTVNIDKLVGSGNISLSFDPLSYKNSKNVKLHKFHLPTGVYTKASESYGTSFNEKGKFLLISDR